MTKDNGNQLPKEQEKHFATGEHFIYEPTGSATHINLDGQWEHDFYDKNKNENRSQGSGDNPLAE